MGIQRRQRSHFLIGTGATAASLLRPRPSEAADFSYKLASVETVDSPGHVRTLQIVKAIKGETKGRLEISVFPDSQLGGQSSLQGQLRSGAIQFMVDLEANYSATVPIAAITSVGLAFTSQTQPWEVLDGKLGEYIRAEFINKGMYAFQHVMENGFRQTTSSLRPLRTAEDFTGYKVRTPPAQIYVDLFKALGASPTPIDSNEMYTACQTHLVDGVELPYLFIQSFRIYEVQKYITATNHIWAGNRLAANLDAWRELPPDIQEVVTRNVAKYTLLDRKDATEKNIATADKLQREGLVLNSLNTTPLRPRLAAYYAHWKAEFGETAWSLLEAKTGKLG